MALECRLGWAPARVSAETALRAASKTRVRRLSPTRWLRIQQPPARQEQVGQCVGNLQPMQVLRQASVAHFLKAEDPLDHPEHVLDLGAHAGLATVGGLDRLVDALAPSKTLIGEVLRSGRPGADRIFLTAIGLISPNARLFAVQQIPQRVAIGHIRRRSQHRVHQLRTAVDSDVRLHAKVVLFAFCRLVHLRIPLAVLVLSRTRRPDNRRIDNRPGRDLDAAAPQMIVDGHHQFLSQFVLLEQMAKLVSARNCARRVVFRYFSNPVKVVCFIAILR